MSEGKKCAHKACSCMAAENAAYCSQFCQDSAKIESLVCDCGHDGCKGMLKDPEVLA